MKLRWHTVTNGLCSTPSGSGVGGRQVSWVLAIEVTLEGTSPTSTVTSSLVSTRLRFSPWIWIYIHTYMFVVVNFDVLAPASDFGIKRGKLSSSVECRIWTRVSGTKFPADWKPANKTDELSRIKLKNLNSVAHPYDQRAISLLEPTASWLSHLALTIYVFVVANFNALTQASDFQIKRRQVFFLCWTHDSNQGLWTKSPEDWIPPYKRTKLSRTKL